MAKKTNKQNTFKAKPKSKPAKSRKSSAASKKVSSFSISEKLKDQRLKLAGGFVLITFALFLLIACISYLFTFENDQSLVESILKGGEVSEDLSIQNWLGNMGAMMSYYVIFRWFGLPGFILPFLIFLLGYKLLGKKDLVSLPRTFIFSFFAIFWLGLLLGHLLLKSEGVNGWGFISGGLGFELAKVMNSLIGWGTYLFLICALVVFTVFFFNIKKWVGLEELFPSFSFPKGTESEEESEAEYEDDNEGDTQSFVNEPIEKNSGESSLEDVLKGEQLDLAAWTLKKEDTAKKKDTTKNDEGLSLEVVPTEEESPSLDLQVNESNESIMPAAAPAFTVPPVKEDDPLEGMANYDPTLELAKYQYPTKELLNEYQNTKVQVSKEELERNKDKIVETLSNFKIGISSIKATIGPTVTLYEIIPEAGVKISKIKNLEDDIALNLAALGIRIIAPIPGKGTIGIEVPNKNREMVAMHTVIQSPKFTDTKYELPVVLGKTISNEIYVTDLTKMPHLLMAGATGQGKSVGLNVLITSLLYKKHPSEIKFVLIDPKKVELTLYRKLERHFLAMLPDADEAIITDTKKVIYTLNSLCMEMDARYELLKTADCRNLKEYNKKFVNRKLNPSNGHKFLPYIVLIIDELSDLMMTAGKEVETPIARLAQLARAVGIHLIVATQRPSVNVITGLIKANFPARASFRVTSKIDSRTILDMGGAEQLVGLGDMLLSMGSDTIRLQCAFIDTSEVDRVCEFIGAQMGYDSAFMLPEFEGDQPGDTSVADLSDRDKLFEEAAHLIVSHQQGSTSLIQRKLKLGYNRAGRIIDQLEAAGIVGPFEGSKARKVLVPDEFSLEQLLISLG